MHNGSDGCSGDCSCGVKKNRTFCVSRESARLAKDIIALQQVQLEGELVEVRELIVQVQRDIEPMYDKLAELKAHNKTWFRRFLWKRKSQGRTLSLIIENAQQTVEEKQQALDDHRDVRDGLVENICQLNNIAFVVNELATGEDGPVTLDVFSD